MPDHDDVVRRAFLLDAPPLPPLHGPPLPRLQPFPARPAMHVVPPRFDPPALDVEQLERATSIVQQVHDALVAFGRALASMVRSIAEALQRAFPAPLLVQFAEGAKYVRRMEAHRHRTAGRPRSRLRPGRRRRHS